MARPQSICICLLLNCILSRFITRSLAKNICASWVPGSPHQAPHLETLHLPKNTKYKIQNPKYKIQNTKYKIQNTKYKIQNTKYKIQIGSKLKPATNLNTPGQGGIGQYKYKNIQKLQKSILLKPSIHKLVYAQARG